MAELKALSQDVLKNALISQTTIASFKNFQVQLYQMSETTFNGVSLLCAQQILGQVTIQYCWIGNTVSILQVPLVKVGQVLALIKHACLRHLRLTAKWNVLKKLPRCC